MIVFSPYFEYIDWTISALGKEPFVFNYTGSCDLFPSMSVLIPNPNLMNPTIYSGDFDSMEFDMEYARSIIRNPDSFNALMDMMISTIDNPEVVIVLLTEPSPYRDAIKESLRRLIRHRYGYPTYEVNNKEELIELIQNDPQEAVSILGINAYEQDRVIFMTTHTDLLQKEVFDG